MTLKTVFVLLKGDWRDSSVLGVYASKDQARAARAQAIVDDQNEIPCGYYVEDAEFHDAKREQVTE